MTSKPCKTATSIDQYSSHKDVTNPTYRKTTAMVPEKPQTRQTRIAPAAAAMCHQVFFTASGKKNGQL
jgi:hypothetical protein